MSYLLDTNVICEIVKPKPSQNVLDWINRVSQNNLFISGLHSEKGLFIVN